MSITAEMAKDHAKDPAVLCCRAEAGTVLEAANLGSGNFCGFRRFRLIDHSR